MAAARRRTEREDAVAWPRMSASFWAALLLASLLIAYCVLCISALFASQWVIDPPLVSNQWPGCFLWSAV
ncbi:hypothetical protein PGIGA_G00092870 [Pangasianodon gigas]|uniref:Uncharacterized protein n=1 Tax=Pangasianodon gigas TaxID=30993 RepID=A0ACC5XDX3_PANGG|nr:hypothetical protein [Pangasianodon gigas]